MCGIVGFVGSGDEATVKRMMSRLRHRGPDGDGHYFSLKDRVGLGHRRLSVIDLEGGAQPMWNEDKSIAIIFNGEIYNFLTLRACLEGRHVFKTHSDTEVLVHLYEDEGEDFLKSLEGMFALAIWDAKQKKLFLARDRFGEKPLYWTIVNGAIVFASEPKALFEYPCVHREIDTASLVKYFFYEYVPAPATIFKNIQKLEAGSCLIAKNGSVTKKQYYRPSGAALDPDGDSALDILDRLLNASVRDRLVADVPVGIFLSGGIDSSTIAYYAQKNSSRPIETFSIGFEDPSFDESRWARRVAHRLGTHHHERVFTTKECLETIPQVFQNLDEPIADASLLPTFLLASFARSRVTVALGGDGSDELLLGYPTFFAHRLWPWICHSARAGRMITNALPVSWENFSFGFKAKQLLSSSQQDDFIRNQEWLGSFRLDQLQNLFHPSIVSAEMPTWATDPIEHYRKELPNGDRMTRIQYFYLKHYLAEDILTKVDRASMMCSLEVRSPFLGRPLAEFLIGIPTKDKLRGSGGKYILKKLMKDKIGKDVVYRKKKGFGIPLARWLAGDMRELMMTYLAKDRIEREGLLNAAFVDSLVRQHIDRRQDNRKPLWTLLAFELWREHYGI